MAAISSGFAAGSVLLSPLSHALISSKRSSDSFIGVLRFVGWKRSAARSNLLEDRIGRRCGLVLFEPMRRQRLRVGVVALVGSIGGCPPAGEASVMDAAASLNT